jgi:hypothetical protein
MRAPTTLVCGHTFCRGCVTMSADGRVSCATCKCESTPKDGQLPINYLLNAMCGDAWSVDTLLDMLDDCAVCLAPMRVPKTLTCGHTFCSRCVQQMTINATRSIQCALCRRVTTIKGAAGLTTNVDVVVVRKIMCNKRSFLETCVSDENMHLCAHHFVLLEQIIVMHRDEWKSQLFASAACHADTCALTYCTAPLCPHGHTPTSCPPIHIGKVVWGL